MLTTRQKTVLYEVESLVLGAQFVPPDFTAALNLLDKEIALNSCFEMEVLSLYYHSLIGSEPTKDYGFLWGGVSGCEELAFILKLAQLYSVDFGILKDESLSEMLLLFITRSEFKYESIANQVAHIQALVQLGNRYDQSNCLAMLTTCYCALLATEPSTDIDNATKYSCLAWMTYHGYGVKQDFALAFEYTDQAIFDGVGDARAFYISGCCLLQVRQTALKEGCVLHESEWYLELARRQFERACLRYYGPAFAALGYSYQREGDFTQARKLYTEGQRLEDPDSIYFLQRLEMPSFLEMTYSFFKEPKKCIYDTFFMRDDASSCTVL